MQNEVSNISAPTPRPPFVLNTLNQIIQNQIIIK